MGKTALSPIPKVLSIAVRVEASSLLLGPCLRGNKLLRH